MSRAGRADPWTQLQTLKGAVAKTRRVKRETLARRRRQGDRVEPLDKRQRGRATSAARRHQNVLWHAVRTLEGSTVAGEMITRGKVRALQRVVDALADMHRVESHEAAQEVCVIAAPHDGNDGLCRLTRYSAATVSRYLRLLAAAGVILYQHGRCGELSLVGFPLMFERSAKARAWCGARLVSASGARGRRRELDSWWQPILQALCDGRVAGQAAELLEHYRAAYDERERERKERADKVAGPRLRKKNAKIAAAARAAAAAGALLTKAPALVELRDSPTIDAMVKRQAIAHAMSVAAARRQPAAEYPKFLGGNSQREVPIRDFPPVKPKTAATDNIETRAPNSLTPTPTRPTAASPSVVDKPKPPAAAPPALRLVRKGEGVDGPTHGVVDERRHIRPEERLAELAAREGETIRIRPPDVSPDDWYQ